MQRVRERLGKPKITEPKITVVISILVDAFSKLNGERAYFEGGMPRAITHEQVSNFHQKFLPTVPFPLVRAVVGAIDSYFITSEYDKINKARKAAKNKV